MNKSYNFDEILIQPSALSLQTSRDQSANILARTTKLNMGTGYPIIVSNMHPIGTFDFARKYFIPEQIFTCVQRVSHVDQLLSEYATIDEEHHHLIIPTFGISEKQLNILNDFLEMFSPTSICFDVANGHNIDAVNIVNQYALDYPQVNFISGNYANPEVLSHVNTTGVCIGIGSGSLCLTRATTGIGYPQASLISSFVDFVADVNVTVDPSILISDGGIKSSADVCKALFLGADMVMIGGLLLKTAEVVSASGGYIYGNSSYKADPNKPDYAVSEGKLIDLTDKTDYPSIVDVIRQIKGGIHSMNTYTDNLISRFSFNRLVKDYHVAHSPYEISRKQILMVSPQEQNNTLISHQVFAG